jgi:hypothetical protein
MELALADREEDDVDRDEQLGHSGLSGNDEVSFFGRHADGCHGSRVEVEVIGLHAIREDNPRGGHL